MGRPRSLRTTVIHRLLDKHQSQVVVGDKVVAPSSDIWEELFELLPKDHQPSNPKAVYTEALKWWRATESVLSESVTDDFKIVSVLESRSDSNTSINSTLETQSKESIKFKVQLSYKVWTTVSPVQRNYKSKRDDYRVRTYNELPPGAWTNVIVDAVTQKRRDIPCGWTFENNRCYYSGKEFLAIRAKCNICSSILCGVIENEPEENQPVDIKMEVHALNRQLHENQKPKNVRIGGEYAKKLYETKKPATVIRRSLMKRNASLFQKPSGRVPSANAIRCGQYRRRQKDKLSTSPYDALSYLKASTKYMNTIHFIGKDPFTALYTSPAQLKLYKAYKRKNRFTEISSDATAGVANKLDRPGDQKSGQIFFYTMVISDGFLVPIHQMLSELNDSNWLTYFMSQFVRLSSDIPNQSTTDMSMALLNASVRSFTSLGSVANYVNHMFALVSSHNASNEIPPCFVRIDIAHFMKNVTTCDALKSSPKTVREFFIRCVALMMTISDIEEAREHILSVIIVAISKTEGSSDTMLGSVPCEIYKRTLVRKITGYTSCDSDIERADMVEKSVLMETEEETTLRCQFDESIGSIGSWLSSIETEAKLTVSDCDDGDRDNLMYNPGFVKYFIDLCKLYPLWSGICCPFFVGSKPTASSAKVESHIKVVKQSMADVIPCSVDKFVQENMDMVEGLIIEASQDYIRFVNEAGELQFDNTGGLVDDTINENSTQSIEFGNTEDRIDQINNGLTESMTLEESETNILDEHIAETEDLNCTIRNDGCPACNDKNWPSGAHKCISCGKNVHIFDTCSLSIGDNEDEGYGEKRICVKCDNKKLQEQQNIIDEMGHTEKWSRKPKREMKKSKYLAPVPHWNLNNHFDKNVKIGFLSIGNMSSKLFTLNKETVRLRNTSTFDALAQILAALFAYLPSSRSNIQSSNDQISKISIALKKNENMKKVNTMRAQLLSTFIYEIEMKDMMKRMLINSPTIELNCNSCQSSKTSKIPFIPVNITTEDFSGLNDDIATTLKMIEREYKCSNGCKNAMQIQFKTILFITLQEVKYAKLADIPGVIKILEEIKIFFGAILYMYPVLDGDLGHYVAVIKVNASWIMFDDKKFQSHFVTGKKIFAIHSLLYTENVVNKATRAKNCPNERTANNIISDETTASQNVISRPSKPSSITPPQNDKENVPQKRKIVPVPKSSSLTKIDQNIINNIEVLGNGCSYMVGNKNIRFVNTCSFDTITQILAAACAFDQIYNDMARVSKDEILQLAVLLATSGSKVSITNMRSKVLFDSIGTTNVARTAIDILTSTLKHTPSLLEIMKCSNQICINEEEVVTGRPYLSMSFDVFERDMDRIEQAIAANLNMRLNCRKCNENLSVNVTRVFGEHLFIEMPITSLDPKTELHEEIVTYRTGQLKSSIRIGDNVYSLFALILFHPPLLLDSIGHYVAAIKVKSVFIIFDDMRKKPYILNENEAVVIHGLFYKKDVQEDGDESSSFCIPNCDTDDSL